MKVLEEFIPDERDIDERGPTRERIDKAWGALDIGYTGVITIRQSPVERAVSRGQLDATQGRAAHKLYQHYFKADLRTAIGSVDLDRVLGGDADFSHMPKSLHAAFHRERFRKAFQVVEDRMGAAGYRGKVAAQVLRYVIIDELTFETAGLAAGYEGGTRAQIMALHLVGCALNILVKEWGL